LGLQTHYGTLLKPSPEGKLLPFSDPFQIRVNPVASLRFNLPNY
jgi:hypothetical protein